MKITELSSSSAYQVHLHMALDEAVSAYEEAHDQVSQQSPLTEETATPELTLLHYALEQRRATALLLAACCVEAVANLYLSYKATQDQFAFLEWSRFVDKWTVLPSLFVPSYSLPKDGQLYQDLKRLNARRNALVHLKESVSRSGEAVHRGSIPEVADDEHMFIRRCRSLPDRLIAHIASFDKTPAMAHVTMTIAIGPTMLEMRRRLTTG